MNNKHMHKRKQFDDLHQLCKGILQSLNDELKGKECVLNQYYYDSVSEFSTDELESIQESGLILYDKSTTGLKIDSVIQSTRFNEPTLCLRLIDSNGKKQCVTFECIDLV